MTFFALFLDAHGAVFLDAASVSFRDRKMADEDWADLADAQARSLPEKVVQLSLQTSDQQHQPAVSEANPQKEGAPEEPVSKAEASLLTKILRSKLVDTGKSDVEVQRVDPKSPLYSVKSFEDLRL